MKHLLFNCNKVSQYVSEALDEETTFPRRAGIKFHLMMCRYCARYEEQLATLRKTIRTAAVEGVKQKPLTMSEKKKESIQKMIAEQQQR